MGLKETIIQLDKYLMTLTKDLSKAAKGNKAAAQRVRTGSIKFEKQAKTFRKESVKAEKIKTGKKPAKKKAAKKIVKKKAAPKKKAVKKVIKKAKKR